VISGCHNSYDLRIGSGCNLGKSLSKRIEMSQLVKHKEVTKHEEDERIQYLLHEVLTEMTIVMD